MNTKKKLFTALGAFVLLILVAGFGLFKPEAPAKGPENVSELSGKTLAGTKSRMPSNSSKIFFESLLGTKLSSYVDYDTVDETLYALKSGKADAAWFCDVTADYLVKHDKDLKILETADPKIDRFGFGLALRNDEKGCELAEKLNVAIGVLNESGKAEELLTKYTEGNIEKPLTEDDMSVNKDAVYSDFDRIYIGVSGNTWPIDMVDEDGDAYGFSVEFCDELGKLAGKKVSFVYEKEESMFSALMAGKIDAVLCYGSGRNTVDTGKSYVMTDSYLTMQKYEFVVLNRNGD